MIQAGDVIENPVTGERLVFRKTSRETNGEAVVLETFVKADGFVATAHVHPHQEERFQILRGTLGFRLGREKIVAGPGQRVTVAAGTAHKFWNAGDDEAHFVCEVRPALQFEQLIETMFGLAADGKTNRKGMPNPLRSQSSRGTTSTTSASRSRLCGCSGWALRSVRPSAGCWATRRRTSWRGSTPRSRSRRASSGCKAAGSRRASSWWGSSSCWS
jgi:quercetin dioxygenase-like cupin family protein